MDNAEPNEPCAGAGAAPGVDFAPALAVADSVLYEGYLLYPYRASSPKNRVRFQFGVLGPRAWIEASDPEPDGVAGSAESWWCRTECLLEATPEARVDLALRYLQLVSPPTEARPGAPLEEAIPRQFSAAFDLTEALERPISIDLGAPGAAPGAAGDAVGDTLGSGMRRAEAVEGRLEIRATRADAPFRLYKVSVRVENRTGVRSPFDRPAMLRRSLLSTHLLLGCATGSFLSLLEPPQWAASAAAGCANVRTFPVLIGGARSDSIVLSSPIILYDRPEVAPESPGDLFDATEIDEILSLRTLTMTEDEKAEARATDPRAAEIVDRVDAMPDEVFARLHGAVRSMRAVRPVKAPGGPGPTAPAGPDAAGSGAPGSEDEHVVVAGVRIAAGSRVRLRPRGRGTDAQDMFVDGRPARVGAVLADVDGSRFLAVGLEDNPRTDLEAGPGRFLHFTPEEIEPLPEADQLPEADR